MRWFKIIASLFAVGLIVLLVGAIPLANRLFVSFEPEIIAHLEARYPELRVGSLALEWEGVDPIISVHDFDSDFAFSAQSIVVPIELWASLLSRDLVTGTALIVGPSLDVNLSESGEGGAAWSLAQRFQQLRWEQARLRLHAPEQSVEWVSDGSWSYRAGRLQLEGDLVNELEQRSQWRVQAEIGADGSDLANLNLYFGAAGWNLPPMAWQQLPLDLDAVKWNGELWLDYQKQGSSSQLRFTNNSLELANSAAQITIQGGEGSWSNSDEFEPRFTFDGWHSSGYPLAHSRLLLSGLDPTTLTLSDVALQPWLQFLPASLGQEQLPASAEGTLASLRLELSPEQLSAAGSVSGSSWQPLAAAPGWRGLDWDFDLDVERDPASGVPTSYKIEAQFASSDLQVLWPQNLTRDLNFSQFDGSLRLIAEGEAWQLHLPQLNFQDDVGGGNRLSLLLNSGQELDLNLTGGPRSLASVYRYLPAGLLRDDPAWYSWLQSNLEVAQLDAFELQAQGDWAAPQLQLALDISDLRGSFADAWPQLSAPGAQLRLRDDQLTFSSERLLSSGLEFSGVELQLGLDDQRLQAKALVAADVAEQLAWLQSTPLVAQLPERLLELEPRGPALSALNFELDLASQTLRNQNSVLALRGVQLNLGSDYQLYAEEIYGDVELSLDGWALPELRATLNGEPVTMQRLDESGNVFQLRGSLRPASLLPLRLQPLSGFITGQSQFEARLALEEDSLDIALSSDLRGLRLRLPPPLGKAADQANPMQLSLVLSPEANLGQLQAQGFSGAWLQADQQQPAFATSYGAALPELRAGVVAADIRMEQLDLEPWLLPLALLSSSRLADQGGDLQQDLHLQLDQLDYKQYKLYDLNVSSTGNDSYALSSNKFKGEVRVGERWQIDFEQLQLPNLPEATDDDSNPKAFALTLLPDFELNVDELYYQGYNRGQLRARGGRQANGLDYAIAPVSLQNDDLKVELAYLQRANRSAYRNELNLSVAGSNINTLLSNLTSERAQIAAQLHWEGAWSARALKSGDAELSLELEKGVIRGDRPNALISFLGLISIDNILKRLKLDFSDINSEGTSFTSLEGQMRMSNGRLVGVEPLRLISSAGNLQVTGSIDFPANYMDQRLEVTLPLSKSLPVAAIIAGAPQLAPAFWLTDQLAAHTVNRFTSASYTLRGDLADPTMELERLFNAAVD